MRGWWWKGFRTDRFRGMHTLLEKDHYQRALVDFDRDFDRDPEAACRDLFLDLLAPADGSGIIEQSCDVIGDGPTLLRLFPGARFIHVVRDGRDASASRVAQGWHYLIRPRTRRQGLKLWEERMRFCGRGAAGIPDDRLLVVELESLLDARAGRTIRRITKFLGQDTVDPEVRRYRRRKMSSDRAHADRWRRGIGRRRQAWVAAEYERVLDRLVADGVNGADVLRAALHRESGSRAVPAR